MKIAFMGTHGVGKTTLCFELAAALKRLDRSVDVVKEVARRCPLPINRETTRAAQLWILHNQIAEEIALEPSFDVIVCDRAVLDNYAYLVNAAGRQPALESMVASWMQTYHLLVKVPVMTAPRFDGTRDVSVVFQKTIDGLIDELIVGYGLSCLRLPADDRGDWVPTVLAGLHLPPEAPQLDLF